MPETLLRRPKQKTAYEIELGLVGSEMCIRDSFYLTFKVEGKKVVLFFHFELK